MNLFNCFQAVAFYTLVPFMIMWLFDNGNDVWGYLAAVGEAVGFVILSMTVYDKQK